MFETLSTPMRIVVTSQPCTRKASPVLPHGQDKRAIAVCTTAKNCKVYLCAACLGYIEAECFSRRFTREDFSATMLRVLADVLAAGAGYLPPSLRDNGKAHTIWHNVKRLEKLKLAYRSRRLGVETSIFVARDACPDPECLRRHGHSEKCGLSFGEVFAERMPVKEVA